MRLMSAHTIKCHCNLITVNNVEIFEYETSAAFCAGTICVCATLTFLLWKTFPCSMNSAEGARLREFLAEAVRRSRGFRMPAWTSRDQLDQVQSKSTLKALVWASHR